MNCCCMAICEASIACIGLSEEEEAVGIVSTGCNGVLDSTLGCLREGSPSVGVLLGDRMCCDSCVIVSRLRRVTVHKLFDEGLGGSKLTRARGVDAV